MQFRSSTVVYVYVLLGAILFANIDGVRADDNLRKQEVLADNRLTVRFAVAQCCTQC